MFIKWLRMRQRIAGRQQLYLADPFAAPEWQRLWMRMRQRSEFELREQCLRLPDLDSADQLPVRREQLRQQLRMRLQQSCTEQLHLLRLLMHISGSLVCSKQWLLRKEPLICTKNARSAFFQLSYTSGRSGKRTALPLLRSDPFGRYTSL